MRPKTLPSFIPLLCVCTLAEGTFTPSQAQSNIVVNGSFEQEAGGWVGSEINIYLNQGAADGNIHIGIFQYLQQNLNTVPGRDYVLSVAGLGGNNVPLSLWNGAAVTLTNFAVVGGKWDYRYCYVHAQSDFSPLRFESGIIDDVRVRWVEEPIVLLSQPQSRSAYAGSSVSFIVTAEGVPPLRYQWFFNSNIVAGATNVAFSANQLRLTHSGSYHVIISNSWHSVTSNPAQLQILTPPTSPEIVAQPNSDLCPAGYAHTLQVVAVGEPPLAYQWFRDGGSLSDATNSILTFSALAGTDAGSYTVLVSNQLGTALSLPATLTTTNVTGGGRVTFDTLTNNSPIFDVDGNTLLGAGFAAQVYAGAAPGILRPVGAIITFPTTVGPGHIKANTRTIPDVAVGQTAYIQLRAWELDSGANYEQARALGGKFGFSSIFPTVTSSFARVRTASFSLRAGEPFFVAGVLGVGLGLPGQMLQFTLTGETGARYLVEKQQSLNNWVPFLILTNTTGTSVFNDPSQTNSPIQIYRARILD